MMTIRLPECDCHPELVPVALYVSNVLLEANYSIAPAGFVIAMDLIGKLAQMLRQRRSIPVS
jgi:hypothetical protein